MSEYIITDKQLKTATEAYLEHELSRPITEVFVSGDKLPEIVRCRDCRYFRAETMKYPAFCRLWISRALFRETVTGITTYLPKHCEIKPDGFCAWGERG